MPSHRLLSMLVTILCSMNLGVGSLLAVEPSAASTNKPLRIATYNVSLYGRSTGQLATRLTGGKDRQAKSLAAVIQTVRPDILLLNEIDYQADGSVAKTFAAEYLAVSQHELEPIEYRYVYSPPSNTGIDSSLDLNANGKLHEPDDSWGYGAYPGQYAFAILSRYPIDETTVRTFQNFRWSQLPNALQPMLPRTNQPYFEPSLWQQLRLSSKNHVDVSVKVNGVDVHILASHPTPPVFDGPEDRNGCRNHDEIIFWKHYIENSSALVDDAGHSGGLSNDASFVILGDLNSDTSFGDSRSDAIQSLLSHPRIRASQPRRSGVSESTEPEVAFDTAAFSAGDARVDYVLPSANADIVQAQVFWPAQGEANESWVHASDHRLVWIDVILPNSSSASSQP